MKINVASLRPSLINPILVHDYLLVMRGAERSFKAMCDMWPHAPVATLLYDAAVFGDELAGRQIRTSRLQALGVKQEHFKKLVPLLPKAAEGLDVSGHDVVISSSSAFAHGVRPDTGSVHLCYCYTPFRYAWYEESIGLAQAPRLARPVLKRVLSRARKWDLEAASRATHYVAISKLSQSRIAQFWGIEAPIVYPPVEVSRFEPGEPEDFFLVVCELVRHKNVGMALEAARRAAVPIKVVGGGADERRLKALYGAKAEFLGRLSDADLTDLFRRSRALIVPNIEEFGIAAVEAQASGRPVFAARAGGVLETVIEGETGAFFTPGDVNGLADLLRNAGSWRSDSDAAVSNAQRFSTAAFHANLGAQLRRAIDRAAANGRLGSEL